MKVVSVGLKTLTIAVMTYNRPDYLRNCIESLARHAPSVTLHIFDDKSSDPDQIAYLAELASRDNIKVFSGSGDKSQHGGLYNNMQLALESCDTEILLFLQDDTQIVRRITSADIHTIKRVFENTKTGFIYPFFWKWRMALRGRFALSINKGLDVYRPKSSWLHKPDYQYADVCIANVSRLREVGWKFASSEEKNGLQAAKIFGGMVYLSKPIGYYCPEVTNIYRHRDTTSGNAQCDVKTITTFHDLSQSDIKKISARDLRVFPTADAFLKTSPVQIKQPYVFKPGGPRWDQKLAFNLYKLLDPIWRL
jgi:glycosyltransferase involved in cell wall biosynthesis